MIIFLVRHTTVNNPRNLCYGQSEIPLADTFKAEARAIAQKLPTRIEACISSPSQRCTKLAKYLYGDTFTTSDALKELDFGAWELRPWSSIGEQEIAVWSEDFVHNPCPGGESFNDLQRRVLAFWHELQTQYEHKRVLLVTHGGVMRGLLAHIHKKPLQAAFGYRLDPASVVRIDTDLADTILL